LFQDGARLGLISSACEPDLLDLLLIVIELVCRSTCASARIHDMYAGASRLAVSQPCRAILESVAGQNEFPQTLYIICDATSIVILTFKYLKRILICDEANNHSARIGDDCSLK